MALRVTVVNVELVCRQNMSSPCSMASVGWDAELNAMYDTRFDEQRATPI